MTAKRIAELRALASKQTLMSGEARAAIVELLDSPNIAAIAGQAARIRALESDNRRLRGELEAAEQHVKILREQRNESAERCGAD